MADQLHFVDALDLEEFFGQREAVSLGFAADGFRTDEQGAVNHEATEVGPALINFTSDCYLLAHRFALSSQSISCRARGPAIRVVKRSFGFRRTPRSHSSASSLGSSAQKTHLTPFRCCSGVGSTPRSSSSSRAPRCTLAYKYCVMSENSQPRSAMPVFLKARSNCGRFFSKRSATRSAISRHTASNSACSSALTTGKFGS